MERIATYLWSLTAGALLTAIGLASDLNWAFIAALALGGAAAAFSFLSWWTNPGRRVFLEEGVTTQFLRGLYADRTTVHAEMAARVYLGKWIKVTGKVHNIYKPMIQRGMNVQLAGDDGAILHFKRDIEKLKVLHKADTITAQGKIGTISGSYIGLTNCELLSVNAPANSTAPPEG